MLTENKNDIYKKEFKNSVSILKTKNEKQLLIQLEKYTKKLKPNMQKLKYLEEELRNVK